MIVPDDAVHPAAYMVADLGRFVLRTVPVPPDRKVKKKKEESNDSRAPCAPLPPPPCNA